MSVPGVDLMWRFCAQMLVQTMGFMQMDNDRPPDVLPTLREAIGRLGPYIDQELTQRLGRPHLFGLLGGLTGSLIVSSGMTVEEVRGMVQDFVDCDDVWDRMRDPALTERAHRAALDLLLDVAQQPPRGQKN